MHKLLIFPMLQYFHIKNFRKPTVLVQLIFQDVVTCFYWDRVYAGPHYGGAKGTAALWLVVVLVRKLWEVEVCN